MTNLAEFLIRENQTLTEAFSIIDKNKMGAVFVVDASGRVIGLATDGDIRRWLIKNKNMEAAISTCMNAKFKSALVNTPREAILKMLDHKVHLVPILGSRGELVDVVTRERFPLRSERRVFARAKSPVRVSFGGGGTDLTSYFVESGGAVMNATISMYSHSVLKKRDDSKIRITSRDLKKTIEGESIAALYEEHKDMHLILSLIKLINPNYGFELQVGSDFPVGSGLGGSAVVLSSIIGCFNQFREDRWDNYEMAEMAFQAERLTLSVAGGWQDQYATVFGGFNFMEFTDDHNVVHPLRVAPDTLCELEESLVLCFAGGSHKSGDIHSDQKKEMQREDIKDLVAKNKDLTYRLKNFLLKGQLTSFGRGLHEAWMMKRQFSSKISTPELDAVYQLALDNGAIGGKLLGAGGGGYFIFYVKPLHRFQLEKALTDNGQTVQPFIFEDKGLQAWTVREDDSLDGNL
jgi:D-glycero-alpha-D-manno-heptose-7-phosphate kinase